MTIVAQLQTHGIRRQGTQRSGFRYALPGRRRVAAHDRARIASLRLPPAWSRVAISPSPAARVQAVGRDAAGRWQYVYHAHHVRRREQSKFERMLVFGRALPKMRRAIARDLRQSGLDRNTVLACILRILSTSFLRPGSDEYADENGSYGLATLRKQHVQLRRSTVRLAFPGKSGIAQERELHDPQVARVIARLLELPGKRVFKFVQDDGSTVVVRRSHINQYLKSVMGQRFSAKDFRTWAGTLICACALSQSSTEELTTVMNRKRCIVAAVKETARRLGNTPAVCRSSYISPAVVESFAKGRVIEARFRSIDEILARDVAGLRRCERALLTLLGDAGRGKIADTTRRVSTRVA